MQMTDRTDNNENTALNMAVPETRIDGKRTDVNGENTVNEPYRIYMPNEKISESLINGYFCSQSAFRSQFGFAMTRFRNMCIRLFC